jgi:hypothetical protein
MNTYVTDTHALLWYLSKLFQNWLDPRKPRGCFSIPLSPFYASPLQIKLAAPVPEGVPCNNDS